ncbi:MAG: dihydrolipoyl dehydrogenase [Actinomycetota bacterium]|nr:dihydrolipoyl dehydrogenase [Euzebyaceae bacterium]MDQ3451896.1 dihydrolipoyl dehydrogenase [Actinomycetota bacterium]
MSSDIVVLGGGPGGYAVALRAVTRGQTVTIVESDKVGGTCLHWGCIPSKAMLYVGEVLDTVAHAQRFGLDLAVNGVSVEGIGAFREKVVGNLHKGLAGLLRSRNVEVVEGHGTVADDGRTVLVGDQRVSGNALVVATGSRVRSLPGIDVDGHVVITSDEATRLPRIPRRALVIGSGAVGLEFASLWRSLGAEEVTVVEVLDRIAPLEDPDLSKQLARNYRKRGITTLASARVESVKVEGETARVEIVEGETTRKLIVDTVLVAVGRAPRSDGIGLEELGVVGERGYATVDEWCRTPADGVFAVGDLLAPPALALAHAGFAEGFLVADIIAGAGEPQGGWGGGRGGRGGGWVPIDYAQVPRVTYTSPEVASVGLTEPQARDAGHDVVATQYSLRGNAKGIIHDSDGFVKVVAASDGEVLGVHVIGPHATDLIAEAQLITSWGALPSEVAQLVHPHPTLAEAIGEAHLAAAGTPFHTH